MSGAEGLPWWADVGPDQCEFCLQSYYQETGYHCVDCDRPVCPVCATTIFVREVLICPDCSEPSQ